jgi:hypothetical protein
LRIADVESQLNGGRNLIYILAAGPGRTNKVKVKLFRTDLRNLSEIREYTSRPGGAVALNRAGSKSNSTQAVYVHEHVGVHVMT